MMVSFKKTVTLTAVMVALVSAFCVCDGVLGFSVLLVEGLSLARSGPGLAQADGAGDAGEESQAGSEESQEDGPSPIGSTQDQEHSFFFQS